MGEVHDISGAREKREDALPVKWADEAMFQAEPQDGYTEDKGVVPKVYLLWMTPDPLGAVAAMAMMYEGRVVRNMAKDISDADRRHYFAQVQETHLQAPLEAVKLHFMFEGVDRAWTQQLERQRTAVYAEQSLRFAVLDDLVHGTSLPPSLFGTEPLDREDHDPVNETKQQRWRDNWDRHMIATQEVYQYLVNDGMPQEDARGLLPLSTATRVHYATDLRNLIGHAGNRLCTQAQFPWRLVFSGIVQAIRYYSADGSGEVSWQQQDIANSQMFRPVCYQLGRCPFNASFDRHCSIRERVHKHNEMGTPSEMWDEPDAVHPDLLIRNEEWLLNPDAARQP